MKLLLTRYSKEEKQTIGRLFLIKKDNNAIIKSWDSLELPCLDNKTSISSIPEGTYVAKKHVSPRFGECLWLQDVPGRSEILIHKGNYHTDIRGCILIGTNLHDINKDGYLDVKNSGTAMNQLMKLLKNINEIEIKIIKSH